MYNSKLKWQFIIFKKKYNYRNGHNLQSNKIKNYAFKMYYISYRRNEGTQNS